MRRVAVSMVVVVLIVLGFGSAAWAQNQPGQGENSTGRNDAGFGGGPHCHLLVVENNAHFDLIRVFPSHTGHVHAGNDVFTADPDCDGR